MHRVELRQSPRVESRFRCWCEGQQVTFYARVANVSEGGLFVCTSTPLPSGETARVRFSVAESELETWATVIWATAGGQGKPAGMGMRFDALSERNQYLLREVIARESRALEAEAR